MTKHFRLLPLLGLTLILGACHDDKDNPGSLTEKTYSGLSAIEVSYNGTPMAGKCATVVPVADREAAISMYSQFDLAQLGDAFKNAKPIPGPGVLPGTPQLTLKEKLGTGDGCYTFSGASETDFVTYSYSGTISDSKFTCDFTDVLLKNQTFAGTAWKPMPQTGLPTADTQPIRIVWTTSLPIPIPALEAEIQDILRILVNVPFIPAYNNTAKMSLTEVIANGLRTLAFDRDGNLPVTYLQTANGASVFTMAPKCAFQYVPLNDYSIKLFVNPTDVLSLILLNNTNRDPDIPENPFGMRTRAAEDPGLMEAMAKLLATASPMLPEGIPMVAQREGDNLHLYISRLMLIPLLKEGIIPMLQNPSVQATIEKYLASDPSLAPYAKIVMGLFELLPTILDQTTDLQIGLNLVKA